jgi:outer membrane protein assembly factor BamD
MNPRILFSLLLIGLVAAGCGTSRHLDAASPEEAYRLGLQEFERGRYDRAIEAFQNVYTFGRTHEWAVDTQYYLAHAYYRSGQHLLAANEFDRFAELYRTDGRAEEAAFMRAQSYYHLSPPFQLDQTDTEHAIANFQRFISQYPQSERVREAGQRITELREKLAQKQFETGRLYERRGLFEAAGISYLAVLERYPTSAFTPEALLAATRVYTQFARRSVPERQAERYRRAVEAYERLAQLFPESPRVAEGRALYQEALAGAGLPARQTTAGGL